MAHEELGKIIGSIKKAINPELNIPADEQNNPVNYRINRLRALAEEIVAQQKEQTLQVEKLEDNLAALLQELNSSVEAPAEPKEEDVPKD